MFEPFDVRSCGHLVQDLLMSVETVRGWVVGRRVSPHCIKRLFVYLYIVPKVGKSTTSESGPTPTLSHTLHLFVVPSMADMVSTLSLRASVP